MKKILIGGIGLFFLVCLIIVLINPKFLQEAKEREKNRPDTIYVEKKELSFKETVLDGTQSYDGFIYNEREYKILYSELTTNKQLASKYMIFQLRSDNTAICLLDTDGLGIGNEAIRLNISKISYNINDKGLLIMGKDVNNIAVTILIQQRKDKDFVLSMSMKGEKEPICLPLELKGI